MSAPQGRGRRRYRRGVNRRRRSPGTKHFGAGRAARPPQHLGHYLRDELPVDFELLADRPHKGLVDVGVDLEAHSQDRGLVRGQGEQDLARGFG